MYVITSIDLWGVIIDPCPNFNGGLIKTAVEVKSLMINCVSLLHMDVIAYARFNPNAYFVTVELYYSTRTMQTVLLIIIGCIIALVYTFLC